MKSALVSLICIATLLAPLAVQAEMSPAWVSAPAYAPNIRFFVYANPPPGQPAPYVAVQNPDRHEAKVQALLQELKDHNSPLAELLPNHCYELKQIGRAHV